MTERQDAETVPLDEAKEGILQRLSNEKKQEVAQVYLQGLKDKATIVYAPGFEPAPAPPAGAPMPITPNAGSPGQ